MEKIAIFPGSLKNKTKCHEYIVKKKIFLFNGFFVGWVKVKIKNLQILKVMAEDNVILVKGSIPGPNKSIVTIESTN